MGMPFDEASGASNTQLMSWYLKNFGNRHDSSRLEQYDEWFELEMLGRGKNPDDPKDAYLFHPALRLSYTGNEEATEKAKVDSLEKKPKKVKEEKIKKPKIKDEKSGVVKGTKKAYTFKLAQDKERNLSIKRIIKKVIKKYPDANDKSIKIWIKKAQAAQ